MDIDALRDRIHADMPRVLDELSRLVAIPSVGTRATTRPMSRDAPS